MDFAVVLHPLYAAHRRIHTAVGPVGTHSPGVQNIPAGDYLVLMSFECQLAD